MMTIGIAPARNADVQRRLVTIVFSNAANKNKHDVSGASGLARDIHPKPIILTDKNNKENGEFVKPGTLEIKLSNNIKSKYIKPQDSAMFIL
jgi:hypothetical protein